MDMSLRKLQEIVKDREARHASWSCGVIHDLLIEQLKCGWK